MAWIAKPTRFTIRGSKVEETLEWLNNRSTVDYSFRLVTMDEGMFSNSPWLTHSRLNAAIAAPHDEIWEIDVLIGSKPEAVLYKLTWGGAA